MNAVERVKALCKAVRNAHALLTASCGMFGVNLPNVNP